MKRSVLGALSIASVLVAVAGCRSALQRAGSAPATPGLAFEATFATASDFYDRFDFGYSGANPWFWGNGTGEGAITHFHGDHDMTCAAPTTARDVAFGGNSQQLDFSQLFWHCAPGGDPAKGHLMTAVDTVHINYAWFSPKSFFSAVSKVCWDMNETEMSTRKWMQLVFVSQADAVRYPVGTYPDGNGGKFQARGTGGFDLGFTNPDNRVNPGPTTDIHPAGGTLAGFEYVNGLGGWFQNQDTWTQRNVGGAMNAGSDKATRFQFCLENQPNNTIRWTQGTPGGLRTFEIPGQIPQHPVRIVFQDNSYNPPKAENYNPNQITWHWDNIQVSAGAATELAGPVASPDAPVREAPPLGEQAAALAAPPLAAPPGNSVGEAADAGQDAASSFNIGGLLLIVAGVAAAFVLGRRFGRREVT